MIELKSVSKVHRMGPREVHSLRDVSLQIGHGEYVAIMWPSVSGKSSLMQLLGGLDTPTTGSIRFLGRDFHSMKDRQRSLIRRREIGFVFQDSNLVGSLTAVENVALPMLLDGTPRAEALAMALQGLARHSVKEGNRGIRLFITTLDRLTYSSQRYPFGTLRPSSHSRIKSHSFGLMLQRQNL